MTSLREEITKLIGKARIEYESLKDSDDDYTDKIISKIKAVVRRDTRTKSKIQENKTQAYRLGTITQVSLFYTNHLC
jgi:hypothetical protein